MTEDEMLWWHHQLDGHSQTQALGVGDGQGSLACCSPWGTRHNWAIELNWPCGAFIFLAVTIWPFSFASHFPWRRKWHPLQYPCLENSMDGGAWQTIVHGVAESQTWLTDFTFTFLNKQNRIFRVLLSLYHASAVYLQYQKADLFPFPSLCWSKYNFKYPESSLAILASLCSFFHLLLL